MPSLFEPPAPESVQGELRAYAAYLEQHDGAPDFERRTLSARERETVRFERAPTCYDGPFDDALFERQLRRYDDAVPTSPEMQLLLCLVKVNANEAYGVERVLARPLPEKGIAAWLHHVVLLEEGYHTRLLLSSARLFGVRVAETAPPVAITRTLVAGIASLPDVVARPVTLAAEAIGIATFLRAIGAVRRVFASRPALRDALEERIARVLVDEIGHLSFHRLIARPGTFGALHALLPAVALGTRGALREAELLGILPVPVREAWSLDVRKLPDEVRRQAFVA